MTTRPTADNQVKAERCLLLAIDAPDNTASKLELADIIARQTFPWDFFERDSCAPLLFDCLRKAGLASGTPEHLVEQFDQKLIAQTGKNIVLLDQLDGILRALNGRGVIPVLLKGISLLQDAYDHPGHRAMTDIDLLVTEHELTAASAAMADMGCEKTGRRGHHINFTTPPPSRAIVEIHHRLFDPFNPVYRFAYSVNEREMIARASTLEKNGWRALNFSPEDRLIHISCHAAKERFGSLKFVADVYKIIQKLKINWDVLSFLCSKYYCTNVAKIILCVIKDNIEDSNIDDLIYNVNSESEFFSKKKFLKGELAQEIAVKPGRMKKTVANVEDLFYQAALIEGTARKLEAMALMPGYVIHRLRNAKHDQD